jgi:hypothetical protein
VAEAKAAGRYRYLKSGKIDKEAVQGELIKSSVASRLRP